VDWSRTYDVCYADKANTDRQTDIRQNDFELKVEVEVEVEHSICCQQPSATRRRSSPVPCAFATVFTFNSITRRLGYD
jgi:hypothetical protein